MANILKKPAKPVFVPSKPWASAERAKKIGIPGGARVPARFFELAYGVSGERLAFGSKKEKRQFRVQTLNSLIDSRLFPGDLKGLLRAMVEGKTLVFTRDSVDSHIKSITGALSRENLNSLQFSFLEYLRIQLLGVRKRFSKK